MSASAGWTSLLIFQNRAMSNGKRSKQAQKQRQRAVFTDVMLMPDTNPAVSSKAQIEFLLLRAAEGPVNIHPIGTVTKNAEGNELAEMYDMYSSGAVAFSDGRKTITQSGILLKGLQYLAAKNAVLIQNPG